MFEAARRAQLAPFIEKLPQGYRQEVQERGSTLSQGQRQLLSFARALAFDPKILILDEATSSVDTRTEELIQEALDELLKNRTALIIAHRLSTSKTPTAFWSFTRARSGRKDRMTSCSRAADFMRDL